MSTLQVKGILDALSFIETTLVKLNVDFQDLRETLANIVEKTKADMKAETPRAIQKARLADPNVPGQSQVNPSIKGSVHSDNASRTASKIQNANDRWDFSRLRAQPGKHKETYTQEPDWTD